MRVFVPSPEEEEMKWCMVHMLHSSVCLSHMIQCSCFALCIISVYSFRSLQCSSCIGWSKLWSSTWQYTFRASLHTWFHLSDRAVNHQHFLKGVGLERGTCFFITLSRV